jgi:hypothetical protein
MTAPKLDLVLAMENAADFSQTAARSIIGTYAPRSHHASAIATGLYMDNFKTDTAQDTFTINHKRSTSQQIREARERLDWRKGISANLNGIEEEIFQAIVTALAECRGAIVSDQWRQAATLQADALLAHLDTLHAADAVTA